MPSQVVGWTPDGKKVVFSSARGTGAFPTVATLWEVPAEGGMETPILTDWGSSASFSADGSKIAFISGRDGNDEIYVMKSDGSGQANLTNNARGDYFPAWSPHGSKIAFESSLGYGNGEVYVMNADGSGVTRLTSTPLWSYEPVWSPDGSKIAFSAYDGSNTGIYVMNADGSGLRNLTNKSAFTAVPQWSPDGRQIAFVGDGLYVMNADGSGIARVTNSASNFGAPAWRPWQPGG